MRKRYKPRSSLSKSSNHARCCGGGGGGGGDGGGDCILGEIADGDGHTSDKQKSFTTTQ